jgi:predicted metal-binding protein
LKLQTTIEKIKMYYTNCQRINHNVETYRVKRKDGSTIINYEVTIQQIRVQRRIRYSCHICGETGHKIIDCPKFNDMKNMFKNKRMHI